MHLRHVYPGKRSPDSAGQCHLHPPLVTCTPSLISQAWEGNGSPSGSGAPSVCGFHPGHSHGGFLVSPWILLSMCVFVQPYLGHRSGSTTWEQNVPMWHLWFVTWSSNSCAPPLKNKYGFSGDRTHRLITRQSDDEGGRTPLRMRRPASDAYKSSIIHQGGKGVLTASQYGRGFGPLSACGCWCCSRIRLPSSHSQTVYLILHCGCSNSQGSNVSPTTLLHENVPVLISSWKEVQMLFPSVQVLKFCRI